MNQRQFAFISAIAIAVIGIGAIAWYEFGPSRHVRSAARPLPASSKAALGQRAPEFSVSTTSGLFDLSKTDKPVFLEVFATWCPHCQRETAVIDKLFDKYGSQVDFVGVSGSPTAMDGKADASQNDVVDWIQQFGARYPVAYDPTLGVANSYLQGAFPTLVVIDKDKNVSYIDTGEVSEADLSAAIEKAL